MKLTFFPFNYPMWYFTHPITLAEWWVKLIMFQPNHNCGSIVHYKNRISQRRLAGSILKPCIIYIVKFQQQQQQQQQQDAR